MGSQLEQLIPNGSRVTQLKDSLMILEDDG